MSARDPRTKLLTMGVFLLPVVLVKGVELVMNAGPEAAVARPANHAATIPDVTVRQANVEWSEQELAAARHINALRNAPFGASPLFHVDAPVQEDDPPPPDETRRTYPPPAVIVRVILRTTNGNIALINGKYYKVGDRLGDDGWVVTRIDSDARAVHIRHEETAQTEILRVPLPR